MKKLIALIIILAFCLSGCNPGASNDTTPPISGNTGNNNVTDNGNNSGNGDSGSAEDCPGKHTDNDDNGLCDFCNVSVIVWLDLYGINDLHGKVLDSENQPGIEELTKYLKEMQRTNDNAVLFSSGDMWQGTAESGLTHGLILTDWMNELGFASMTLGNHEFDWADSYIKENSAAAEFPLLAINIYDRRTNQRADYCTPSVVIEQDGVQIGIIGAIGDCYSSISGEVSGGIYFKTGRELTALVKAEAERLRANGVDFIIYSLHDGYDNSSSSTSPKQVTDSQISSYYDISLSDGYVDIVFEGHTHKNYILVDSKGVMHLQGGGDNYGLSHAKVSLNSANGNSKVSSADIVRNSTYASYDPDAFMDYLFAKYSEEITYAQQTLGYNPRYRDDSDVEQLVATLYYEAGVEMWGEQYDIFLGGGFIRTRSPYNLYQGNVTYSDLYSLLTFDNELVLCTISGANLKSKFIYSTNSDYYVYYEGSASSIKDNQTYYIVTDTYTSTYRWNNLTEVARYTPGVYARDLVADFIEEGGWSN